jgi:hypothetical protein
VDNKEIKEPEQQCYYIKNRMDIDRQVLSINKILDKEILNVDASIL